MELCRLHTENTIFSHEQQTKFCKETDALNARLRALEGEVASWKAKASRAEESLSAALLQQADIESKLVASKAAEASLASQARETAAQLVELQKCLQTSEEEVSLL